MTAFEAPRPLPEMLPAERRFRLRRGDIPGILAALILVAGIVAAFTADWWVPQDPGVQDLYARLAPPWGFDDYQPGHILGADELGRDIFSRIVHGGKVSFTVGLSVATLAGGIGITLGVTAGYRGGWIEAVIMRLVDVQTAFPFLVIAISVVAIVGPSLRTIIIVLVLWQWVPFARLAHAKTLTVKQTEFFRAAVAIGRRGLGIAVRHVVPNIIPPLVVVWTFQIARGIIQEASLSFLGLGVPPPTPTWGGMLSAGRGYLDTAWWIPLIPGITITLVIVCVNVLGDWLSKRLDPRAI